MACFGVQEWVLVLRGDYQVKVGGPQDALLWVWGPQDEQEEEEVLPEEGH